MRTFTFFHAGGASAKNLVSGVVEGELAFLDQHHDGSGRELFADGSGLVDRFGFDRDLELDVREAVALRFDDLAVTDDQQGEAGDLALLHFGLDVLVDGVGGLG